MYLQEIELIGFKSFANKTVLKFPKPSGDTKGITAIVGPNGSGKSNVADAMRWVLGESSSKTLRGKSRDDVIFSGSETKSRMNYAEVTLRINNEDKSGPHYAGGFGEASGLNLTEIEITRRIFRDGEAEFLLNKNKVRREDIVMMLAQASFGQKTYTVIGQGMADSVLSASLQERKEFFEEAAGVRQYQIKRQQALNRFETTRENLAQTELTIQELEPRLKSLGRQVKKLEQREAIEKELKALQISYYKTLHNKVSQNLSLNNSEKQNVEKEISKLEKEMLDLQAKMNQLHTGNTRQAAFELLQKEYNSLMQEKNVLLREEALLRAKKDAEYQKGGQSNVVWLNNKKEELNRNLTNLKDQLSQLSSGTDNSQKARRDLAVQLEQIEKKIATVKNDLESFKKSNLAQFDEENDLREIYALQEKLLNDLMELKDLNQIEDLRNQARAINARLTVYLETLATKKKVSANDLTNLQNQLEVLVEQKNKITIELSAINSAQQITTEKISSLNQQISARQEEIIKIEGEIKLASATTSASDIAKEIENQLQTISAKIALLDKDVEEVNSKIAEFNAAEEEKREELIKLQKEIQVIQLSLNKLGHQLNQINIELAKHTIREEDLIREIAEEGLGLEEVTNAENSEVITEEAHEQIHSFKKQLEIIGGIDEETIKEYNEIKERYDFLTSQTKDLEDAIVSLEKVIEELDQNIKKQFDQAFEEINKEFQKYFKLLFSGGHAEMLKVTLEEEKVEAKTAGTSETAENAETAKKEETGASSIVNKIAKRLRQNEKESYSGIEIKAEPPGKKINSISMLSGGERALTSIALICAIIANNKSPFVFLDEMDAALDESNALRFATIIGELSARTQFIVVTHTRATMSQAQLLYGVTMGDDGISKLLSIELKDAEEMDVVRH